MKKVSYLLFALFILQKANSQEITKANVTYVPLYITSTFTISCDFFDSNFADDKKAIEIESNNFENLKVCLISSKFVKRNRLDVRGKMVINFDNKKIRTI